MVDRRIDISAPGRELFPRAIEISFADTYDKLLRAVDGLDLSRDLLAGVRDYHQSKIANDQNEVMKRLTVIAAVLLLPTFIVGLYGQNFRHIPELAWGFGYWWSWGWIIADDDPPARVLPLARLDRRRPARAAAHAAAEDARPAAASGPAAAPGAALR